MQQYVEKAKAVLMTPTKFFRSTRRERGYMNALEYYAVFALIGLIASTAYNAIFTNYSVETFVALPIVYIVGILTTFLSAGFLHVLAKIIAGVKGFEKTYNLYVYATTPSLLLGWIPFAGFFAGMYSLYLTILGLSVVHKISMRRSAVIVLLPLLILMVIAAVIAGFAVMFLGDMIASGAINLPTGAATAIGLI